LERIDLKPVFLTLVLSLGALAASSAHAADRYTEVWNPPEAQSAKAKPKTHTAAKKKRKSTTSVKQVADKAAESQNAAPRPKAVAPKPSEPSIPRKYGPNGEVMRV
jgi:hypothetical protein